jgi:hypothetical protein
MDECIIKIAENIVGMLGWPDNRLKQLVCKDIIEHIY